MVFDELVKVLSAVKSEFYLYTTTSNKHPVSINVTVCGWSVAGTWVVNDQSQRMSFVSELTVESDHGVE